MAQQAQVIHLNPRGRKAPPRGLSRDEKLARIILHAINTELGNAFYFTREDLLQLRPLQSVATITRYRMVCEAIHLLITSRRLVALSRTELAWPGGTSLGRQNADLSLYAKTVTRLIARWSENNSTPFDTVDLLRLWSTDPQLTLNAKRVAIRHHLKAMAREGTIVPGPDHMSFVLAEPN